jgi:hypothetical protein
MASSINSTWGHVLAITITTITLGQSTNRAIIILHGNLLYLFSFREPSRFSPSRDTRALASILLRQVDFELQKMHAYFIARQESAENSGLSDIDFTWKMVVGRGGKL